MSLRRHTRHDAPAAPHHMTAEQRACARLLRDAEKWITDAHRRLQVGETKECHDAIALAETALYAAKQECSSNANPG